MIKNHLSKILGEKRINQTEFSKKTGIRRQTINELYHEINVTVSMEQMDAMCRILKCNIGDIFEYIPDDE